MNLESPNFNPVPLSVLTKVPKKIKQKVADDLRSIFYASSKEKALAFYEQFNQKWESTLPSAVKSLDNSINSCLTFFAFPEEEWISLRTTNIIERLNKEFKRRTRPMEILAGADFDNELILSVASLWEIAIKTSIGKIELLRPFDQLIPAQLEENAVDVLSIIICNFSFRKGRCKNE